MRFGSFRRRVFLGMALVILSAMLVSAVLVSGVVKSFAREEITRSLASGRSAYEQYMVLRSRSLFDKVRALAGVPHLKAVMQIAEVDAETLRHTLQQVSQVAEVPLLLLLDSRGKVLAKAGGVELGAAALSRGESGEARIEQSLAGSSFLTPWHIDGQWFLVAAAPVVIGGQVLGALALGERVEEELARDMREASGSDVVILDGKTVVVTSRRTVTGRSIEPKEVAALTALAQDAPSVGWEATLWGAKRLVLPVALENSGLTVVLSRGVDEFGALYRRLRGWLLGIGLGTTGLGLLVTLHVSHRLSKPIGQLTQASGALACGDLSVRVDETGDDELAKLASAFNDMAGRIESLLEDLRQTAQRAESANLAKSEFLSNISHELRTPIHCIMSYSQLGMKRYAKLSRDKILEYYESIHDGGSTLVGLVNELLDLSALEAGKMRFSFVPTDFEQLVTSVVHGIQPLAAERRLRLDWTPPDDHVCILLDRKRIEQVVRNLMSNAVKFSPEEGTIRAEMRLEGRDVVLSIADEGPGIPEDEVEIVFEKFVQSSRTKTGAGGTGLGLSISRTIARAHGGEITAENLPGRGGALFTLRLVSSSSVSRQPKEFRPRLQLK